MRNIVNSQQSTANFSLSFGEGLGEDVLAVKPFRALGAVVVILCILLSSCFKEKAIAPPHIITDGVYIADMGENYTQQVYFNMQTHQFVDSNSKYDYDMYFDCGNTYSAWVNGSNLSLVYHTGKTDLATVTIADTTHGRREELGSGNPDSNAIGNWQINLISTREVYIISRGEDSAGHKLGYVKVQMGDYDVANNSYIVTFSNLDNSNLHTVSVKKVDNKKHIFLSFNGGGVIHDFEPNDANWDLFFTQYSVWFGAPNNIPYKVTGVLTNPLQTRAYFMDSTTNFDSITIKNVTDSRFNNTAQDNIGYLWKHFEFSGSSYDINEKYNYIVRSGNGQIFKLRFLSFGNALHPKGYPQFQYYLLR
jgi:hypothetical protein